MIKRLPAQAAWARRRLLNSLKRSLEMATKPTEIKATAALFGLITPIREKAIANWAERAHGRLCPKPRESSRCRSMQAADHDHALAARNHHFQASVPDQGHRSPASGWRLRRR